MLAELPDPIDGAELRQLPALLHGASLYPELCPAARSAVLTWPDGAAVVLWALDPAAGPAAGPV